MGEHMSLANAKPSAHYVPAYQASGVPYVATVTNGTATIGLRYVTSEVTVSATGAGTVSFGLTNSANFTVPAAGSVTFRIKTKHIVLTCGSGVTMSVVAALTNINGGLIPTYDQDDYGSTTVT
jgi:hypothetical protein